jgi:hypothetical protein
MSTPLGWNKQSNSNYSKSIPSGTSGIRTELITTLDGRQQIVKVEANRAPVVIYEKKLNDQNWSIRNNNLDRQLQASRSTLQSTANSESFRLIQSTGNQSQKNAASNSNSFRSIANSGTDNTVSQQNGSPQSVASGPGRQIAAGRRLVYPSKMSPQQDRIGFTAVEIVPGRDLKNTFQQVDSTIYLGIQSPVVDTNTVQWGEGTLNEIERKAFEASRDIALGEVGSVVAKAMGDVAGALSQYQDEARAVIAGAAIGRPDILSRAMKKVLNPNLELLFQGPQLRSFQMSFKMSPRDEDEGSIVKSIIKYFKRHMAVREDATATFLKAPHAFTIQYLKGNQIHPSIGKISPRISGKTRACALVACNVDYTPLGTYMTYNDSKATMVSYTLNLQFQEIEPLYDKDYFDNHDIGF